MVQEDSTKEWTVVFLVDAAPPENLILLERSPDKSYAPNWFTGIGGKVGDLEAFKDETPLESAYRELEEETDGYFNKKNIELAEFARCIYDTGPKLYYYWALYSDSQLPRVNPDDGSLHWVSTEELLQRDVIPTTMAVCEEWSRRKYEVEEPFTVFVKETGMADTIRLLDVDTVEDGLL